MATYKNWELGTDFDPYENLVLNYIFAQWSQTNPAKGPTLIFYDENDPTSNEKIAFRVGFPGNDYPYQITTRRLDTVPVENLQTRGHWLDRVRVIINIKCKTLDRPESEPMPGIPIQFWNMEEEVERILRESKINAITGILRLQWGGNERVYLADDNFMKTEWESNTLAILDTTKMTTASPT